MKEKLYLTGAIALFLLGCHGTALFGNPENPTVTAGSAAFNSPHATSLEVTASNRSIISWEKFSISSQESTRFILPHSSSAVLNRVTSSQMSEIHGLLSSNGTVYLINPNGVLIGPSGIIDAAGFLASTLDLDNQQFINAGDLLFSGSSKASIINQGTITCWGGDLVLLAYQVENTNALDAPAGTVALGCGEHILLTPFGNQRITIQVPVARPKDSSESTGIHQTGTIQAIQTELKADGNPYTYAIKNEGWINATGIKAREGRIFLTASDGLTSSSGTLLATNADGSGGEIHILGDIVTLTDKAKVDVSGHGNAGAILIGGDYQGNNPDILNSRVTWVGSEVVLSADSLQNGNGGKIITWADGETFFYGKAHAIGGPLGGDGGFAEISGKNNLDFQGNVNLTAPQGKTGTLLLDPTNITFSTSADSGFTVLPPTCVSGYVLSGNPATATVNIANLLTNLGTCSVTISTASTNGNAGTVTLANALNWTGTTTNTLTVNANSNITFNAALTNGTTAGIMNWNSAGAITQAVGGTIVNSSGTGAINLTTTGTDITLNDTVTNSSTSTGTIQLSSNRDFFPNQTITNSSTSGTITALVNRNITFGAGAGITDSSGGSSTYQTSITTAGVLTTSTTSTIATSGTCNVTVQGNNTTVNIQGPVNHNSSGLLNIKTTTAGNISTATTGVITANSGAGNLSITSAGALTLSGALTFNGGTGKSLSLIANAGLGFANLTYNADGTCTLTSTTSTLGVGSSGNTFQAGNLSASGAINMTAGGTILFGSSGTFDIGSAFASGAVTLTTAVNIAGSSTSFNLHPNATSLTMNGPTGITLTNLTYSAPGTCSLTSTGGTVSLGGTSTFNSGAGGLTINASTITTSGTLTANSGAGNLSMTSGGAITLSGTLAFNAGTGKTASLTANTNLSLANFTYNADGICTLMSTTGSVTLAGSGNTFQAGNLSASGAINATAATSMILGSGGTFDIGSAFSSGAVTLTAGTTITSFAGPASTFNFHPNATSLTINGPTGITLDNLTYSAPNTCTLTSTGGPITLNGVTTFNTGAGGWTINANTTFVASNTSTINYNSSNPFNITATTGNFNVNGPINLATSAALNLTCGGAMTLLNRIRNTQSGPINVTSTGVFAVGSITNTIPSQLGSAGGDVTISASTVNVFGGNTINAFSQIGFDSGNVASNLIFTTVGSSVAVQGGSASSCYALIGHGSQITGGGGGTRTGNITFPTIPGSVSVLGNATNCFAQIGHVRALPGTSPVIATGNISLSSVTGSVTVSGGTFSGSYGLIGHGGPLSDQPDNYTGDIQVATTGTTSPISIMSGSASQAFAGIGHLAYMNGAGQVTIQTNSGANTISVTAGSYVNLQAQSGAEAVIGGYVNASSGSGNISIGTVNVVSQNGNDILMSGPLLSSAFNGTLIGALAYTGAVPIVPAGSASANTTITSSRNLLMQSALDGSNNQTFCLVQNGSGSPLGGPFTTTINANAVSIAGGLNESAINSLNNLTLTATGPIVMTADFLASSLGTATITSNGPTTITGASLMMTGLGTGPLVQIVNTTSNLTITSSGEMALFNNANINLSGGSGTLNITSTNNAILLDDNSFIQNAGTGSTVINSALNIGILVEEYGPSFISSNGPLALSYGGDLSMAAANGIGNASILSAGTTTITGGKHLAMLGSLPGANAIIQNSTGNLTVSSASISLQDGSQINLTGGSGTLQLNSTADDILLFHNSTIQNQGTGNTTISANADLQLHGDTGSGGSSILTHGTTQISAGKMVLMTGALGNTASIRSSSGNLSVQCPFFEGVLYSDVTLLGGTGTLSINATNDFLLQNNSLIQTLGSGPFNITIGGSGTLIGSTGNGSILGNTGTLTINSTNNLNLKSNAGGSAVILTNGPLNINAGQSVNMGGLGSGQQSLIQTTAGNLTVIANVNMTIHDFAAIKNLGSGNLTIVVDQQNPTGIGTGRFILDPNASMTTNGGLLLIFTAMPNGYAPGSNLAFGFANGNPVETGLCPFIYPAPSTTNVYGTFYNTYSGGGIYQTFTSGIGDPYTIFYKFGATPVPPAPPPSPPFIPSHVALLKDLSNVSYASSELSFILGDYTQYYWDRPYWVCCDDVPKNKRHQKSAYHCDLLGPESNPTSRQNWTNYPVYFRYPRYFSETSECNDLDHF